VVGGFWSAVRQANVPRHQELFRQPTLVNGITGQYLNANLDKRMRRIVLAWADQLEQEGVVANAFNKMSGYQG